MKAVLKCLVMMIKNLRVDKIQPFFVEVSFLIF
jgi:hypothetical protein